VKFPELILLFAHQQLIDLVILHSLPERHSAVGHCEQSHTQCKDVARLGVVFSLAILLCLPYLRRHVHLTPSEFVEFLMFAFLCNTGC
jgi:hypothetical protein